MIRGSAGFASILALVLSIVLAAGPSAHAASDAAFTAFLQSTWPDAEKLGVSRATFDAATRGLEPDLKLPDLVIPGRIEPPPGQAEFVQTPADYLRETSFARLAAKGRTLYDQNRNTLTRIEREFGVPGTIILAIWGRESDYLDPTTAAATRSR